MVRFVRALTATALVLAPAALAAQAQFEGVITAHVAAAGGGGDLAYMVKGDHFRMDMTGRGGSMFMLVDGSKGTMEMVMPEQRMYMEQSTSGNDASGAASRKAAEIKRTGKKEMIAGYECEHVLVTGDDGEFDVCAASGLGSFVMMTSPMSGRGRGAQSSSWQKLGRDIFPLKVQKSGGPVEFEVTKIEKKSLDNSLFVVPDGFQKMDMGMGRMGRPPR